MRRLGQVNALQAIDSPLSVILSVTPQLESLSILDVGCGEGQLARVLAARGAKVLGIDPGPEIIARARLNAPEARFLVGTAEELPRSLRGYDVVTMVNALHHVPMSLMESALTEAARVLGREGVLIVIEPEARGSFFDALRIVEDETEVRQAAQAVLHAVVSRGDWVSAQSLAYTRTEMFCDADEFIARIVAVDPSRQKAAETNRQAVIAAVARYAPENEEGRLLLEQPIIANVLTPAIRA
jgi:2-polyprenyl-3-methyl-5-hydroxy-6-metoxy-1,4-benzoquinol methylase